MYALHCSFSFTTGVLILVLWQKCEMVRKLVCNKAVMQCLTVLVETSVLVMRNSFHHEVEESSHFL